MGEFLTTGSALSCPHGGAIIATPTGPRISFGGDQVIVASDTFTIAGCPFPLLLVPHPCVLVQWILPATQCGSNRASMLTTDSVGLCVAADGAVQGPVLIQATQPQAGGR